MRVGVMDWDTHRYLECFFRDPDDGRDPFHDKRPSISCPGSLYDQPWPVGPDHRAPRFHAAN